MVSACARRLWAVFSNLGIFSGDIMKPARVVYNRIPNIYDVFTPVNSYFTGLIPTTSRRKRERKFFSARAVSAKDSESSFLDVAAAPKKSSR